jgi:hypothetical protein
VDATKGKRILWQSEPVTKNLLNHFLIDTYGNKGRVLAMKGAETFVVALDGFETLRYLRVEGMIGFRICKTRTGRDAAWEKSYGFRTCPAPARELEMAAA